MQKNQADFWQAYVYTLPYISAFAKGVFFTWSESCALELHVLIIKIQEIDPSSPFQLNCKKSKRAFFNGIWIEWSAG